MISPENRKYLPLLLSIIFMSALDLYADKTKWIAVGDLQNWYADVGCEKEVGRTGQTDDQQDGLQWPAQFADQDNQAAKALWIGATNYYDPIAKTTFNHKVVHTGPRFSDNLNEMIPLQFDLFGKFDHPTVVVDGDNATEMIFKDEDVIVDEMLPADRVLVNVVQTSMGIKMTRKIYAFTNQYHQNYFIYDYVLENNGVYNQDGDVYEQTLEGVQIFFQYRYAISKEMGAYGQYWSSQSATWGHNTMNEMIGEHPNSPEPNDQFYDNGETIRALYSWHGLHSGETYNNIGAPDNSAGGDGHLGGSQFVGVVTLHADKSPGDTTDDISQPSTTWYVGSDYPITDNGTDQFNPGRMSNEYAAMSAGHPPQSHAEAVCVGEVTPMCSKFANLWAEPGMSNPGGYSQGQGFGPYTLAPGDSIHIVMAEGVAGLSREMHYTVGGNWKNNTLEPLPDGSEPVNRDEYKNYWVFTGIDSIIQTFKRARENYASGFNIPNPPPPPSYFTVTSGGDRISLAWDSNADSHPNFAGYKIFRAIHKPDTTYEEIYDGPVGVHQFDDVTAARGFDYYYYIVSYDDGSTNDIQQGIPLISSKFYTMTNQPASLKRSPGKKLEAIRVVPNPYNIRAREMQYGIGAPDRIMFLDIPGNCTIRIFTERGDLIKTIHHTDGSGDETWNSETDSRQVVVSGLYIAHFEVTEDVYDTITGNLIYRKGESAIRKLIIIR